MQFEIYYTYIHTYIHIKITRPCRVSVIWLFWKHTSANKSQIAWEKSNDYPLIIHIKKLTSENYQKFLWRQKIDSECWPFLFYACSATKKLEQPLISSCEFLLCFSQSQCLRNLHFVSFLHRVKPIRFKNFFMFIIMVWIQPCHGISSKPSLHL